jgi:hypothetical protein
MRRLHYTAFIVLLASLAAVAAPYPPRGAHVLRGPYAFDERDKRVPQYYEFDGKRIHTIAELKATASRLPPGSLVYFDGTCTSTAEFELGQRPYMTFSAFRRFCQNHHVRFDWYIGI